jgi:hypothetical protein
LTAGCGHIFRADMDVLHHHLYSNERVLVKEFVEDGYIDTLLKFINTTNDCRIIAQATHMLFYIADSPYKTELFKCSDIIHDLLHLLKTCASNEEIAKDCLYILTAYFETELETFGLAEFIIYDGVKICTGLLHTPALRFATLYFIKGLLRMGLPNIMLLQHGTIDYCDTIVGEYEDEPVMHDMIKGVIDDALKDLIKIGKSGFNDFETVGGVDLAVKVCKYKYVSVAKDIHDLIYGFMLYDSLDYKRLLINGYLEFCVDSLLLHDVDTEIYKMLNDILSYFLECYTLLRINYGVCSHDEQNLLYDLMIKMYNQQSDIYADVNRYLPKIVGVLLDDGFDHHKLFDTGFVDICVRLLPLYDVDDSAHTDLIKVIGHCMDRGID